VRRQDATALLADFRSVFDAGEGDAEPFVSALEVG
jgi:hypothetical protein